MKFPPPPEPPTGGEEFLHQLADYYRSLVEYYQRAATAAAQQLAHLEAILHPERLLDFPTDAPYWLTAETVTSQQLPVSSETPEQETAPLTDDQETGEQEELVPAPSSPRLEPSQILTLLLEAERGKVLHLDFIIRKLYGRLSEGELPRVTTATRQLLAQGVSQGKWYAVPDSPDCWTLELSDLADFLPTASSKSSSTTELLPGCDKLDQYENIKTAIAACLEEHSPESMTIQQVIDWFYPQGVPQALKKRVYELISKGLTQGCNRLGWRRVSPGRYVWKPNPDLMDKLSI